MNICPQSSLNNVAFGVDPFPLEYEAILSYDDVNVSLDPFHRHSYLLDIPIPTDNDSIQQSTPSLVRSLQLPFIWNGMLHNQRGFQVIFH